MQLLRAIIHAPFGRACEEWQARPLLQKNKTIRNMSASTLTQPTRSRRLAPGRFPQGFDANLAPPLHDTVPGAADSRCSESESDLTSQRGTVVFRFEAAAADRVRLAADFTGWDKQPIDLRRREDGVWQTAVELPSGQYSYRFLVDGQWRDDPRCLDYEPNPFGTFNALITVG
jgi:hypothetical protein